MILQWITTPPKCQNLRFSIKSRFSGKRRVRSAECGKRGVWKMWGVENEECGKRGVWKMRGVENV